MPFTDTIGAGAGGALTLAQLEQTLDTRYGQENVDSTTSYPSVAVVSNALPNVFGAWAQLVANAGANPQVIKGIWIRLSTAAIDYEIELGIGAAGLEVVVYTFPARCGVIGDIQFIPCDVRIAGGSRLAARQQDNTGGLTTQVLAVWKEGA